MVELEQIAMENAPKVEMSKWIKIALLIDRVEMEELFSALPPFGIYNTATVCGEGEFSVEKAFFLSQYGAYVGSLERGEVPDINLYRSLFSSSLSVDQEALYLLPLPNRKQMVRVRAPVVQMQAHAFDYSSSDQKFRSMVLGKDTVLWGIQLSFPQLFMDQATGKVINALGEGSANGALFKQLQKWVRRNTVATPFSVEGRDINAAMRIGKNCFSWIDHHPQLKKRGIGVRRDEN